MHPDRLVVLCLSGGIVPFSGLLLTPEYIIKGMRVGAIRPKRLAPRSRHQPDMK